MQSLLLTILGAVVAWLIVAFFLKNYETSTLFTLIGGIIIGYSVGKKRND